MTKPPAQAPLTVGVIGKLCAGLQQVLEGWCKDVELLQGLLLSIQGAGQERLGAQP